MSRLGNIGIAGNAGVARIATGWDGPRLFVHTSCMGHRHPQRGADRILLAAPVSHTWYTYRVDTAPFRHDAPWRALSPKDHVLSSKTRGQFQMCDYGIGANETLLLSLVFCFHMVLRHDTLSGDLAGYEPCPR